MTESYAFFIACDSRPSRYALLLGCDQMRHATETTDPLATISGSRHGKYRVGIQAVVGGQYLELAVIEAGKTVIGSDPQFT
jgi:hypothetical protein